MSWRGFVAGIVLALLALVAWVQLSDRATSARIAPELDSPKSHVELGKSELQTAGVVLGREPEANAAGEHIEPAAAVENASIPDGVTRLHGFVFDESGAPLAGVTVYLSTDAGEFVQCNSASDGAWALETTEQGDRLVTARKTRFAKLEVVLSMGSEIPSVRHDLRMQALPVVLVDLVLPDGTPALPALREAGVLRPWRLVPLATKAHPGQKFCHPSYSLRERRASGSFLMWGHLSDQERSPATMGFLTLHDPAPLFVSLLGSDQVFGTQKIDVGTTKVTFTISPVDFTRLEGRVTARVVAAEDGSPLACTAEIGVSPILMGRPTTSNDGQLDFGGLVPGSRFLVLRSEGRAEIVQPVEVLPGDTQSLGEIRMFESVSIRGGIVTSEDPLPQAVLEWGLYDPGKKRVEWVKHRIAVSSSDGSFELNRLEAGTWAVRVKGLLGIPPRFIDPRMMSATVRVDASIGSVEGIELALLAATRVTLLTGKVNRQANWMVHVHDLDGMFAGSARVGLDSSEADLSLWPGNFDLELTRDGELIERRAVAVDSDAQRIDWPLE